MATNKDLTLRLQQTKRQWQGETDRVVHQLTEDVMAQFHFAMTKLSRAGPKDQSREAPIKSSIASLGLNHQFAQELEQIQSAAKRRLHCEVKRVANQVTRCVHKTARQIVNIAKRNKQTDKNQCDPEMSGRSEIDLSDVATNAATSAQSNKSIGLGIAPKRILVEANSCAASKRQAIDVTGDGTIRAVQKENADLNVRTSTGRFLTLSLNCLIDNCPFTFLNKPQLERHLRTIHNVHQYRCFFPDCNQSFPGSRALSDHYRVDHCNVTKWPCSKCDLGPFKGPNDLHSHASIYHCLGEFVCSIPNCQFKANNRRQMYNHSRNHRLGRSR